MNNPPIAPALVPATAYSGRMFPIATVSGVHTNIAMKYQSVTYRGPFTNEIGTMKLQPTKTSPTREIGSIQNGVSPHSTPCAPRLIGKCNDRAKFITHG